MTHSKVLSPAPVAEKPDDVPAFFLLNFRTIVAEVRKMTWAKSADLTTLGF